MTIVLAHADMEYFGNTPLLQYVNDLVERITGEGSLRIDKLSIVALNFVGNFAPKITSAPTQGLTSGRLRMSIKPITIGSTGQGAGIVAMQSQRNLTGVNGQAYFLRYRPLNQTLELGKFLSGLNAAAGTTVFSVIAATAPTAALQLAWDLASNSSQITLRGYFGATSNFSDLVLLASHVDTSPLTATVTEGGMYQDGGGGSDVSILIDNMELLSPE